MNRYVAFLRGMNLGRRRIRNDELCGQFEEAGFANVATFLASGNVVFDAGETDNRDEIAATIEDQLRNGLGYEVPTLLRSADEVRAIAKDGPFLGERGSDGGKPQVVLLPRYPDKATREGVLALATEADQLAFHGKELHWLPIAGFSTSELDLTLLETSLGPTTTRTRNTIERLVVKFFA
jgi:uncharacterized protein (DUF1697 family)